MKKILLIALLFSAAASASDTYFKCITHTAKGDILGDSASFSMSQGVGGFTSDGMNFISNSAGGDGDVEKDGKGNVLTIVTSRTIQQSPFVYEQDLTVKKASGEIVKYNCQSLSDEVVAMPVAPSRRSGGCDSYYDIAADGSQCGLRSHDSRVRPY
ncbi:TPA: DUF1262 domain-containing protein [Klebsiella aerogenes]|nr:DUF1262 domain-containing protein [Klebsiella aerogenes]HBV9945114.1 DUF1262 domain-containing protein [Klebsiella aerogenes]HDS5325357.1 DUF1262 domain-containing protein [Klebsiella aerogenes]